MQRTETNQSRSCGSPFVDGLRQMMEERRRTAKRQEEKSELRDAQLVVLHPSLFEIEDGGAA